MYQFGDIRHKLIFQLGVPVFLLLIFMSIVVAVFLSVMNQINITAAEEVPVNLARETEKQISGVLTAIREDLEFASSYEVASGTSAETINFLHDIVNRNTAILKLDFYDLKDHKLLEISDARYNDDDDHHQGIIGGKVFHEEVLSRDAHIGEPYLSEYGTPFLTWSTPMHDKFDTVLGIMYATIDLSSLWSQITTIERGEAYIVDNFGVLILSKDLQTSSLGKQVMRGSAVDVLQLRDGDVLDYTGINDELVLGASAILPHTQWRVVAEVPKNILFEDLYLARSVSLLFIASVIVLFVTEIYLLSTKVFRPLTELRNGVMKISEGDLDTQLDFNTKNEIGHLAVSFNSMTQRLKELLQHLEDKVGERTRELKDTQLDLESKLSELERFQSLTVGRELKMIELKKEIKVLKESIERLKV